jgi:hypothetical protein
MDVAKKKRGRKPKIAQVASPDAPVSELLVPPAKTKRGRKPKYVYNTYDGQTDPVTMGCASDDDHVIMQLSINERSDIERTATADTLSIPDAYNLDCTSSFMSQPCDITLNKCIEPTHSEPEHTKCEKKYNRNKVVDLLKDFEEKNKNNEWPSSTSIHCYWCCHKFDNPPFGIPIKYVEGRFHVFGCFCSLECAMAHNNSSNESMDEIWERRHLINMLSRKIGYVSNIKPAPSRLALKMFGGYMSIDEFRSFCETTKVVNINFPPMMTMTQQVEEINECEIFNDYRYIPLDSERVNKYKEKMNLKRSKPVNNVKNTLDHTMNIKFM